MAEYRGFDFLDYLVILVKWKKLLIVLSFFVAVTSYLSIYFFIDEKFDSTAVVIASEENQLGGVGSLLKSFSNLPVSIPGLSTGGGNTDLFTTLIYSRTNLVKVIEKFGLFDEYGNETMQETIKELTGYIEAAETKEGAYAIKVRASSPQKAADMVNFIIKNLNSTLLELNVAKSRDNREFLEKRYQEIKYNLRSAEDSLVLYQQESGILLAEEQAKSSFESYSKLEAELAAKQIESSILGKLYGEDSPLTNNAKIAAKEFEDKINKIKSGKDGGGLILSLNKLPQRTMQYFRLLRDVEIYNKMLEFIIPLYEQSRFEEQKNIPLLQIIDKGVPPEKKSFPQRALFTLLFTTIVMLIIISVIFVREFFAKTTDPKMLLLKENLRGKRG